MGEQTIITMRRADGKLQELHGPRATAVAAMRAERDGWEYLDAPAPSPEGDAPPVAEVMPEAVPDYHTLTVSALRGHLQERGLDLPSDARKGDLIAALEAADAVPAPEPVVEDAP